MKKPSVIFLLSVLAFFFACQTLFPATPQLREGTTITNCPNIVNAVRGMQTSKIPDGLQNSGEKQGDEFDVNEYFTVLPNLSMQEGYVLDYIYSFDSLGSFPLLAARPADQPPYATPKDLPNDSELLDYWNYIEVKDTEQGYFEFISFLIMADQFYLVWHANYDDTDIICDRNVVDAIATDINDGDFGIQFDKEQMKQINALNNIEPLVNFTDTTAIVEIITFSKWGGFYRMTYTISRSFPHEILDIQQENLVPYDCGILF